MHFWGAGRGMWSPALPTFVGVTTALKKTLPRKALGEGGSASPPCPRCPCQPAGSRLMDSCRQQI